MNPLTMCAPSERQATAVFAPVNKLPLRDSLLPSWWEKDGTLKGVLRPGRTVLPARAKTYKRRKACNPILELQLRVVFCGAVLGSEQGSSLSAE